MESHLKPAGNQITVVFLDTSEMMNVDKGRPLYRTVVVPLTPDQIETLKHHPNFEGVSLCILENK